ncbi:hypothetical protein BDF20DRAFT_909090 [Mycotypha africana]|uniref:uncharacterized protein n=1 Tax=Mycotypha africana TaxID=64632 RepID=UPI002300350F|nr:uncharacterized protein BDF20DRAFT_909090 [Mycotypha africana]KAI8991290.1 hypothetical protein BDF20DRAFT_909090 [Mycotypha africana]
MSKRRLDISENNPSDSNYNEPELKRTKLDRETVAIEVEEDKDEEEIEKEDFTTVVLDLQQQQQHPQLQSRYVEYIEAGSPKGPEAFKNDKQLKNYFIHVLLSEYEFLHGETKVNGSTPIKQEKKVYQLEDYDEEEEESIDNEAEEKEEEEEHEDGPLTGSFIGSTFWTAQEKDAFFLALERCGKRNIEAISRRVGKSKTVLEVGEYLTLLHLVSRNYVKRSKKSYLEKSKYLDRYYARQMSNTFIQLEEELSQKLEKKLEVEAYAKDVELNKHSIQQRLHMANTDNAKEKHGRNEKRKEIEPEDGYSKVEPLELFNVKNMSVLSKAVLNNTSNKSKTKHIALLTATIPILHRLLKSFVQDVVRDIQIEMMGRQFHDIDKNTLVTDTLMNYIINKRKKSRKDRRFNDLDLNDNDFEGRLLKEDYLLGIDGLESMQEEAIKEANIDEDKNLEATDMEAIQLYEKDERLEKDLIELDLSFERALLKHFGPSHIENVTTSKDDRSEGF